MDLDPKIPRVRLIAGITVIRANQGVAQTLNPIRSGSSNFVIAYAVATLRHLLVRHTHDTISHSSFRAAEIASGCH